MTIRRAAQAARAPWGRTKGQGVGRCRLDATAAPEALGLEPSTYAVRLKERARVGWLPRAYAALLSGRGRCGQQKAHSGVWGPAHARRNGAQGRGGRVPHPQWGMRGRRWRAAGRVCDAQKTGASGGARAWCCALYIYMRSCKAERVLSSKL